MTSNQLSNGHRILYLGNNINTDDIVPPQYGTTTDPEILKHIALEYIVGRDQLMTYDVIEAGENFGSGSSREHAPIAIKGAGIQKVRAKSFAELFFRNSINIGLELEFLDQVEREPVVDLIIQSGGLTAFNRRRLEGELPIPSKAIAPRPMTMAEKILARAAGQDYVQPGNIVFAQVDIAMSHDVYVKSLAEIFYSSFGPEARIWDPQRVVLVSDHFIQVPDLRDDPRQPILEQRLVQFGQEQGCYVFDVVAPREAEGICHIILPEKGFIRPGTLLAGTDSHCCTYGALGCLALGVGTTDLANVLINGDTWVRVPQSSLFELTGSLPPHLSAKDIILHILGTIGSHGALGQVMEFRGPVVEHLPMDERLTLANMVAECGAVAALVGTDDTTRHYLQDRGITDIQEIRSDEDAVYAARYQLDVTQMKPQVACPPNPDHVVDVDRLASVPINLAYIGSCTGSKLTDLAEAAAVLAGRHVATGVDCFIVPGSQAIRREAEARGYIATFETAGVQVLKSACGACCNSGLGVLKKGDTGIYATNRNFKGRSGDPDANHYLASPRVVAISAVKGYISGNLD